MRTIIGFLIAAMLASHAIANESVTILTNGNIDEWKTQEFDKIPPTLYEVSDDPELNQKVLVATADKTASGFYLERDVNLAETPLIRFQWRVDESGSGFDETKKSGNDYAFRIYVNQKTGWFSLRTLILARTESQPAGALWDSPYSGSRWEIKTYSFADQDAALGEWHTETLDVAELWHKAYGKDADLKMGAVGIMTDGDNAGVVMKAKYGEISFEPAP